MFLIPLYIYEIFSLCSWIYCILLFSTEYKPDHWIFEHKPETWLDYTLFAAVITFYTSLSSLAGHELFHHKEQINKIAGTIPYTQFFYSHFYDEHIKGHHKTIATDEDPVSHRKGKSVYQAFFDSIIGTHASTWNREMQRVGFFRNRMILYFFIHLDMVAVIYSVAGWGGLKFQIVFATLGSFWLEAVNYLEHYGLRR
jgi:alkane 1-monooxygenase